VIVTHSGMWLSKTILSLSLLSVESVREKWTKRRWCHVDV
jgi:hypothetical protein